MKRILTVSLCFLLFILGGCVQSNKLMTSNDKGEEKEAKGKSVSTDYQVNYNISQFQMPNEVYVSEMSLQKIGEEQLFELWDIPKETTKVVKNVAGEGKYYSINGNAYLLVQGPVYSSLGLCESDNIKSKTSNGKMEEQAKKLFEKWEKISGVKLDINHIKKLETSGDNGAAIEYECSQIYHDIPFVGNFNMDNPYMKSTGNETEVDWLSVINGSYCFASYIVNSSRCELFGAQKMFDEKKKIKLDKTMLSGDKIVDAIQSYMQSVKFNGQIYNVKEASVCYIPLPTSNEGKVFKLTPCWQVLVNGKEVFIENGQKTEVKASWRFYVDAVTGYVYDVNN